MDLRPFTLQGASSYVTAGGLTRVARRRGLLRGELLPGRRVEGHLGRGGVTDDGQPILLCRTADSLYWAGRYLERAEGLARLVLEHTALLVDLPTSVPLTWEPLLAIPGGGHGFYARFERADEASIMQFLLVDEAEPVVAALIVAHARENLRTVRQVFPRSAWRMVNELADVRRGAGRDRLAPGPAPGSCSTG